MTRRKVAKLPWRSVDESAFVETFVDLAQRCKAGADCDWHVPEDEADDEDGAGRCQLDGRDIERDNVADANDRAGNGEGQQTDKLERRLAREALPVSRSRCPPRQR